VTRILLLVSVSLIGQTPLVVGGNYSSAFEAWLTRQAEGHWDRREEEIAGLSTAAQIRARQDYVRKTMLEVMGGLPKEKSPLRARTTGQFSRDGYRVENVIFESQPGMRVTANLYLPTVGQPPYPAVLGVAGHSANGKASATYQAAFVGFVRQGFAVLAFDPPGQGERSEYFDAAMGKSRIGIGTAEHTMAGLQCLLTGHTMARYETWDGVRAFDYLLTRPEVDPKRIAVAGNSGGGTQAAYLAAVEPRLAAVVSSCYMTRWRELWSGPGPQDAEQVFPSFISKGLDFGDFALAWAPRPFIMTTAIQDFFPIAGGRATYRQNQRLFDMLGGGEKAGYFEFDDTHGWSKPRREAAYRFLGRWLLGKEVDGREAPMQPEEESLLYATETGQVATSGGSETVQSLNLAHARRLVRSAVSAADLGTAIGWRGPEKKPATRKLGESTRDGVRVDKLELTVEGGVAIPALLFHGAGSREIVFASSFGKGGDADVLALAKAGTTVLAVDPRGMGESYSPAGRSGYRQSYQLAARAMLVGRNLLEMQVSDLLAAVAYFEGRRVTMYAKGSVGPAAMIAAALDQRVAELAVERSILSYMDVVAAGIHEGLEQAVAPGILARADLPDALRLMAGRRVTLISPAAPNGRPMLAKEARKSLGAAADAVRIVLRGEGWTLGRTIPEWLP
jgi:cephalosporin-C deacetylase-like acetyl esterase